MNPLVNAFDEPYLSCIIFSGRARWAAVGVHHRRDGIRNAARPLALHRRAVVHVLSFPTSLDESIPTLLTFPALCHLSNTHDVFFLDAAANNW